MTSILQPWVSALGLRHQGVLLSAVRGPDYLPKSHPVKMFVRAFRGDTLHSFDPKPSSFISRVSHEEFIDALPQLWASLDELNVHYALHFTHAAQVVAFKHPDLNTRTRWNMVYLGLVKKFHFMPETPAQLDDRLFAPEDIFARDQ